MLSNSPVLFHVLLPVTGFLIGVFGSFTGFGGAFILTPTLALVFGLPYPAAIACALAQMVPMSVAGFVKHLTLGHVDRRIAAKFLVGAIPAAIVGRLALEHLPVSPHMRKGFTLFYVVVLIVCAALVAWKLATFLKTRQRKERVAKPARLHRPLIRSAALLGGGVAVGLSAGFLAVGGGFITIPLLVGLLGVPIPTAVGTSLCQMVFAAVAGTLPTIVAGRLPWIVTGLLVVGSVPGALVGPVLLQKALARLGQTSGPRAAPPEGAAGGGAQ